MTNNHNKSKIIDENQAWVDRMAMEEEMSGNDVDTVSGGTNYLKNDKFFRYHINKAGERVYKGLATVPICDHLIDTYRLFLSAHTTMYQYNEKTGVYETLCEGLPEIKTILTSMFGGLATISQIKEVINTLVNTASIQYTADDTRERFIHRDKICFKNGIYTLATDELSPHSPDEYFVSYIPVMYDIDARCPKLDDMFDNTFEDTDDEYEWLGYCMTPDNWLERMSFYIGGPRTGKSTYFSVITEVFGKQYLTSRDPHELVEDKFAPADLHTKNINLCGDIGSATIKNFHILKRLIGRDMITARHIYGKPFQFVNTCKIMYSCNDAPIIDDKTDAAGRRLRVVICDSSHESVDPFYLENMMSEEEKSGLVNHAIEGLRSLIKRGDFKTTCKIDTYEELSKMTTSFAEDCLIVTRNDNDHLSTESLYIMFEAWCNEREFPVKSRRAFMIDFTNKMKYQQVDKKNIRVGNKVVKGFVGIIIGDIVEMFKQGEIEGAQTDEGCDKPHNDNELFELVRSSVFKIGHTKGLKTFTAVEVLMEMPKGMNITTEAINACIDVNQVALKIYNTGGSWTYI